jgi:Hpt domain
MFLRRKKVEFIEAKSYPAMVRGADAADFLSALKSEDASRRAGRAILARTSQLRDAVLDYVGALEMAVRAGDDYAIFAQAHEIRGLAGTVGLVAAGNIANGLCLYLDALAQRGQRADRTVVMLHAEAIMRAARAQDEATRLGGTVAIELAALVVHKLGEPVAVAAE